MKNVRKILVLTITLSVFLLSFLIGRATALRDKSRESGHSEIYTGTVNIPAEEGRDTPAAATAEKTVKKETKKEKTKEAKEKKAPSRMLFPCGETVLKAYSQTALYSETMDDWRPHTGIDYAAEEKTEVKSVWDGTVKRVYKDRLWGNCAEIVHDGNIKSVYKNLAEKLFVKEGDFVKGGETIGTVGKSAAVEERETAHLHFELWQDNVAINPESYIY